MPAYLEASIEASGTRPSKDSAAWSDKLAEFGKLRSLLSELQIISSPAVHTAATAWFDAIEDQVDCHDGNAEGWTDCLSTVGKYHDTFVELAREELLGTGRRSF